MKTALLLLTLSAYAQSLPQFTISGPAIVQPGSTANLTISLTGVASTHLTVFQLTIPNIGGTVTCSAASAAAAVAKTAFCNVAGGTLTVLLSVNAAATPPVVNANLLTDGPQVTIALAVPRSASGTTLNLQLTSVLAATVEGFFQSVTVGPALSLPVANLCDTTNDGKVDAADVAAYNLFLIANVGTVNDLGGGRTVVDLQRAINAALGQPCLVN